MFHLRVLTVLLSFLLVADASSVFKRFDDVSSPEPEAASTEDPSSANYYDPEIYQAQCGISYDTTFYLEAAGDYSTYEITSNTKENTTYRDNLKCRVKFVTGASPVTLGLFFEHFNVENNDRCNYDYVCVHGVSVCGLWDSPRNLTYVVPANNSFTLIFITDFSQTRTGFDIKVYASPASNYSYSYAPDGASYVWNDVDMENKLHVIPQGDYVDACEVDYGVNFQTNPVTNSWFTESYPIPTSNATVDGVTPIVFCGEGSNMSYYYLQTSNYWDYYSNYSAPSNNRIVIQSPGYGVRNYDSNTNCEVKLYSLWSRKRVTVQYNSFNLEKTYGCLYDSLCVGGVKYCGNWETGKIFYYDIPAYSWFSLKLSTDGSVVSSGFQILVTYEEAVSDSSIYQASSGDGSEELSVNYSYTNDSTYQDTCSSDYNPYPTEGYQNATPYNDIPVPQPFDGSAETVRSHIRLLISALDQARERLDYASNLASSAAAYYNLTLQ